MSDIYKKLKVAAIQASPVFLDREGSTKKACDLIAEAGNNGAELIVFPEGFIPSHPIWYHFHEGTGKQATTLSFELFKNAVEIGSRTTTDLCKAAKDAGSYVVMGLCEKLPNTTGTMFNTQLFINDEGLIIGKHQKIMPTVGERLVHKGGNGDTFGVINSKFGPISGLLCSENSNPLALFALTAEGTRIHAMSWPNHWGKISKPMKYYVQIASQNFAQVSKAFVISACSVLDDDTLSKLYLEPEEIEFLKLPEISGGSMIISPNAQIIAGPMNNEEGILYAEINLEDCAKYRLNLDFSGHYNREDIFQLTVNKSNRTIYRTINDENAQVSLTEKYELFGDVEEEK